MTGNAAAALTGAQVTGRRGSGIAPDPGHKSVDIDMAAAERMDIGGTDLHLLLSRGQNSCMINHVSRLCVSNACIVISNATEQI